MDVQITRMAEYSNLSSNWMWTRECIYRARPLITAYRQVFALSDWNNNGGCCLSAIALQDGLLLNQGEELITFELSSQGVYVVVV